MGTTPRLARVTTALADRRPEPTLERLLADLVPPPRFAQARLDNYVPDPAHPSQAQAKEAITEFAERLGDRFLRLGLGGVCRVDRKSTRLNSSHVVSSSAVFCLNNKK